MRLLLILSACFLVGCGNEYGIKKGTLVSVKTPTTIHIGELPKVKSKFVILKDNLERQIPIIKSRIVDIRAYKA